MPRHPVRLRTVWLALVVSVGLPLASCAFVKAAFPDDIPVPDVKVDADEALVARGRYLSHHVAGCIGCHSPRDMTRLTGPVIEGSEFAGGDAFGRERGFPGVLYGYNLTPTTLAAWSDGEIYRAITSGVSKDGEALFPLMPYPSLSKLADEDVRAIIAYLRTLPPAPGPYGGARPERELDGPLGLLVRAMPVPAAGPKAAPRPGDPGYPAYITNAADCMACHSLMERGEYLEGMQFAGGRELVIPGYGTVRAANITPDEETGIGTWTREMFIARFKAMGPDVVKNAPVPQGAFQTEMPWSDYAGMTETDLGAIYDFLRTLPPVKHKVDKFTPEK